MKTLKYAALAATMLCPLAAGAQEVGTVPVEGQEAPAAAPAGKSMFAGAYADVYYVPTTKFEQGGGSVDGDGYGVRGVLPFSPGGNLPLFLAGEYTHTKLDDVDQTVKNMRFGLGYRLTPMFGAYAEYASIKFNNELSGLGLHGSAAYTWNQLGVHGEIGYLMLSNDNGPDVDGFEYNLGVVYAVTSRFSALADYRMNNLSADGFPDADLNDIRVGVRINLQ